LNRNILAIGIIILFILLALAPITLGYNVKISETNEPSSIYFEDNRSEIDSNIIENVSSLHVNLTGPRFWYIIKTNFSNPTTVTNDVKRYITSRNETVNARATFLCEINYEEGGYGYGLWSPNANPSRKDFYLQLKLGRINWSYYNINQDGDWSSSKGQGGSTYRNVTGTRYFIYAAYAAECYYDLWFNTSEETTFSITQGNETFFYQREDFFGNINIGWDKGLFILRGRKEINVKNKLFAWFRPHGTTGFEFLNYRTPSGGFEWQYQVHKSFETITEEGSENFDKHLFNGESGKWTFKTSILNFDKYSCGPNILLFGADVKFPE
jgi:hypothetical protein